MYQQIDRYTSSRPSYLDDYYDEEDSDLEGFIDDGADEDRGGETDVSRHIRDIFGYDRRRYVKLMMMMEGISYSKISTSRGWCQIV
jgi:hypothetical protein